MDVSTKWVMRPGPYEYTFVPHHYEVSIRKFNFEWPSGAKGKKKFELNDGRIDGGRSSPDPVISSPMRIQLR